VLCGSSILNQHYKNLLERKLKDEKQSLESDGTSLRKVIEDSVQEFENVTKRNYDIMGKDRPPPIFIRGLREAPDEGFEQQHLCLSRSAVFSQAYKDALTNEQTRDERGLHEMLEAHS